MDTVHQNQDQTDPLDRLYADAWRPKAGDRIRGVVVVMNTRDRDPAYGGGVYPIITLQVIDGTEGGEPIPAGEERAVHVLHDVLKNELAAIRPKIEDELGIAYKGKHPQRGYHRYRVHRYGDEEAGFDWSSFGGNEPEAEGGAEAPAGDVVAGDGFTATAKQAERDERDAALSELHMPIP